MLHKFIKHTILFITSIITIGLQIFFFVTYSLKVCVYCFRKLYVNFTYKTISISIFLNEVQSTLHVLNNSDFYKELRIKIYKCF